MLDLIIRGGDVVSRGACRNVRATGTAASNYIQITKVKHHSPPFGT
jgi:hypothetical protein